MPAPGAANCRVQRTTSAGDENNASKNLSSASHTPAPAPAEPLDPLAVSSVPTAPAVVVSQDQQEIITKQIWC